MNCMVWTESAQLGEAVCLRVENLGEDWRCRRLRDASQEGWTQAGVEVLIVYPGAQTLRLLDALAERPPLSPPWLLGAGVTHPALDGTFHLGQVEALAQCLSAWEASGRIPRLAMARLPEVTCLARSILKALTVPGRLRAQAFLPDMAALTVVHPALLTALSRRLYPLTARRHGRTAAGVERSLRLCVESVWTSGQLSALERFFGHSVDPERGKPTNREFLCGLQQRLTAAARRIC